MKTLVSKEKTQMDSTHFGQNGDCSKDTHVDDFGEAEASPQIPSDSYDAFDKFGEPEIALRIGDEFQVELPPLIESHPRKRAKLETKARSHQNFLVGLPIRLTWINTLKSYASGSRKRSRTSPDPNLAVKTDKMEELQVLQTAEKKRKSRGRGHCLVPGLVDEKWNAMEKGSFLLGLYIFEKNFVEVRRFVGTKEMGAILSFYYGRFYRSDEYHRWSDCRKLKGKKGICGQRIFSAPRQQELLSRILPGVSEDCRKAIMEVSMTFGEEKISLVDYVFTLKTLVGIKILVDAVGIGRGKLDLTEMPLESSRSNQANTTRPEIPTGKSLSSLSTNEINKILSGDYRLSKNRSNDIFWEAVWPRLLARGWHSEQPKNHVRHCLVFLMPGIKKFSRKKLVKGEHYFDSLTDVLSKVSKEPELIELDSEGEGCVKKKEEHESPGEKKNEKDVGDLHKSQRHFYLQPRTPKRNNVIVKFTVVDTSLSDGKVRELRTFPSEISNTFTARKERKEDSDEDTSEEESDESVTADLRQKTAKLVEKIAPTVSRDIRPGLAAHVKNKTQENNQKTKKVSKSLLTRKGKRDDDEDHFGPAPKRCRILSSCNQEERNARSGANEVMENATEVMENSNSQVGPSTTSSSRGSPNEGVEKAQPQILIDLNLPQVPPDSETVDLAKGENSVSNGPGDNGLPSSSANETLLEQPLNLNPRRQSTRNQTPTAKVLEAVADGYFTVHKRQRVKGTTSKTKRAKRSSGGVGPSEPVVNSSVVNDRIEEGENDVLNVENSDNMAVESQVPHEANEDPVSEQ